MTRISYCLFKAPQGELLLTANPTELIGLHFEECPHAPVVEKDWVWDEKHPVLVETAAQLREYFEGKRTEFSIPLSFAGTEFQEGVWRAIARIPFGETISYEELACRAGRPKALRAVGTATGNNPIGIIIPCHRVMAKGGGIGGFAGGLAWKRRLLALEDGERGSGSGSALQGSLL